MTDPQSHESGTFLMPKEHIPTFTHDLMAVEADETKTRFLAIIDDVQEHINEYMKHNIETGEGMGTKMRVFSILDSTGQNSLLGIALDLYIGDITFQYIIKVPVEAIEFIRDKDFIAILSKEKKILALAQMDSKIREQLIMDSINIINLNSLTQGKARVILNRENISPNFLRDYDEYVKLQQSKDISSKEKDMKATQIYAKYGTEYKITERGEKRVKKLETKYYSGERLTEDDLKDAYGLMILSTASKGKLHFSQLTDELAEEMKKRFDTEISDMNINDYLLARGYLKLNPEFIPEYAIFINVMLEKKRKKREGNLK